MTTERPIRLSLIHGNVPPAQHRKWLELVDLLLRDPDAPATDHAVLPFPGTRKIG